MSPCISAATEIVPLAMFSWPQKLEEATDVDVRESLALDKNQRFEAAHILILVMLQEQVRFIAGIWAVLGSVIRQKRELQRP